MITEADCQLSSRLISTRHSSARSSKSYKQTPSKPEMTVVEEETKQLDETIVIKKRPQKPLPYNPEHYDREVMELLTVREHDSTLIESNLLSCLRDQNKTASKIMVQKSQKWKEKLKQYIEENSFYDVDLRRNINTDAEFIRDTRLDKLSRLGLNRK